MADVIEVGQTVEWGLQVRDENGALADTGVLPSVTVSLPDTGTAVADVVRVSVGDYVASVVAPMAGLLVATWTAEGENSGDFPHTDFAWVGVRLPPLVTLEDLADELQMEIPADRLRAAQAACDKAAAMVRAHVRSDMGDWGSIRRDGAKVVTVGVAADIFGNPRDLSSFSGPESLSYAAAPRTRRTLFDSERAALDRLTSLGSRVGTVRLGIAPWMTPAPEEDAV